MANKQEKKNFDNDLRNLLRNIYHCNGTEVFNNTKLFLDYAIENKETISNHKYKDNIKKILCTELNNISYSKIMYEYYQNEIKNIFINLDSEYDIIE
jgi:hypothetical protein